VSVVASSTFAHILLHLSANPFPGLLSVLAVFAKTLRRVRNQLEPVVLLLFLGPILATHDDVESEDNGEVLGVLGSADEESSQNRLLRKSFGAGEGGGRRARDRKDLGF
jgi:hypothetical protein